MAIKKVTIRDVAREAGVSVTLVSFVMNAKVGKDGRLDCPVNPKTGEPYGTKTKTYADWLASQDREVVSGKDYAFILNLQKSVHHHDPGCGKRPVKESRYDNDDILRFITQRKTGIDHGDPDQCRKRVCKRCEQRQRDHGAKSFPHGFGRFHFLLHHKPSQAGGNVA